jgi:cell division protein FtsL
LIQKGKSYIYGATAEKLEYDVYEENKVLKAKKTEKTQNKVKLKMVFNILIVFVLIFSVMYRYALITELNYKINKTNISYNEIKNENSRLKVDVEKQMDLQKIKEIAEKKLGMQKPDKYQIEYVNVPKSDYTRVADAAKIDSGVKSNLFLGILNKVEEFTHLLY